MRTKPDIVSPTVFAADLEQATTRIVRNYRDDGGGRVLIPITDAEASIDYFFAYRADSAERIEPLLRWITLCAADFRDSENA